MPHDGLGADATPAAAGDVANRVGTHRLATISASAALQRAASTGSTLSTGSSQVDGLLAGGLFRGKIVEVYGPSGAGKTMLGITAAANALIRGGHVAWIDCAYDLVTPCLQEVVRSKLALKPDDQSEESSDANDVFTRFHHYYTPTLAQLIALVMRSPAWFPPRETHLIVVDGVSGIFGNAFPRSVGQPAAGSNAGAASFTSQQQQQRESPQQWATNRRWDLQREVVAALNKLSGLHDTAVLVISQMATRIDRDAGGPKPRAVLRPALGARAWTEGFWARIVLLRHWGPKPSTTTRAAARRTAKTETGQVGTVRSGGKSESEPGLKEEASAVTRFAGLVKLGNVEYETFGRTVMYDIGKEGLKDAQPPHGTPNRAIALRTRHERSTPRVPAKRNASEIADSESEGNDEVAESEEDDIEELNEMGLSKEEAALLELELTGTMDF